MKIAWACCIIGFVATAVSSARGDYPTLERARELFAPEVLADTNVNLRADEYVEFVNDLVRSHRTATATLQNRMMNYLLTSLTSVVARVSTNTVDDGVHVFQLLGDLTFHRAFRTFDGFATNATACIALSDYIGRLQGVSFPSDLARMRRSATFVTDDAQRRAAWQERERRWRNKQRLQSRVYLANNEIREFRSLLFSTCNTVVLGCREVMDDAEFAAFTNRVVELSKPDESERRCLFDRLDEVKRK